MPSTHRLRLSDLLKPFARFGTTTMENIETHQVNIEVNLAASTGTADKMLHYAFGPVAITAIRFLPELAVASDTALKWTLTFFSGATQIGTYSTYASDTTDRKGAFAVGTPSLLYQATTGEYVEANGVVLSMDAVKGITVVNMTGTIVVEYVPLVA